MIKSETDSAWEINKVTLAEEEMAEKMANLRAKRKPPKLSNVHPSVLELPDNHILCYDNIKKWIKTQEGVVKAEGMRTRMGAEAYIRSMKRYLSTGDWTNLYYGEYEEKPMKWKTIAPAYK